jgi:hypothetical protein
VIGSSLAAYVEQAAAPLDHARRLWFALLLRSRALTALLSRRERRITSIAALHVTLAFCLALYFPVLLFVVGPIVLGVAHVAADVRYLVLRRNLQRWWQSSVWGGSAALIAVRALEELGVLRDAARVETSVAAAFIAVAIAAGVSAGGGVRRAAIALGLLALGAFAALSRPALSRLVFVHAHNVVAVVLWVYLYARRRSALVPLAMIAGGTLLLASGALSRVTAASPGLSSFGLHALAVSDWIAPFSRPSLALGVVSAYVFLQSVHYGVWLFLVPQEELRAQGSLTFRMSIRSLFTDLGVPGVLAVALAALAVIGGAFVELHRARTLYLSLAMFHGYLELALLTFFFVRRGGAPGESER